MGLPYSKTASPEQYYMDLAVQFKDRLDGLGIFADALVKNTESQSSMLQHFLKEEERKCVSPQTLSSEGEPQGGFRENVNHETKILRNAGPGSRDEGVDLDPASRTRTGSGNSKTRPKSGKKNKDPKEQDFSNSSDFQELDFPQQSGGKQKTKNASKRADRTFVDNRGATFVDYPCSEAPGQAMDVDNTADTAVPGRKADGAKAVEDRGKSVHLLNTLRSNQASTNAMARGILNDIDQLQRLIPEHVTQQQNSRPKVRPENASYQVKLIEGTARPPVQSVLSEDSATQTKLSFRDLNEFVEENRLLKANVESLERIRKKQEEEINFLRRELETMRSRPAGQQSSYQRQWLSNWGSKPARTQATVQIYCHRRSEKINAVNAELDSLLKTHFDTASCDLTCNTCDDRSQLNKAFPTIVLCVHASRLGTDVTMSLEGLEKTNKVVVVVLHHKDTHALPKQPSGRLLTDTEYKSLAGFIDMAFLTTKGIYPCDMNQTALSSLQTFIITGRLD